MPWYSKGFLVLWANFVSVNHPTKTHFQEIAAEAAEAAKGKEMTLQSPSWPSCSLFVCASEQSAVHNASGICELKRATSSYRSACFGDLSATWQVACSPQESDKASVQRKEEELWFSTLKNVAVVSDSDESLHFLRQCFTAMFKHADEFLW